MRVSTRTMERVNVVLAVLLAALICGSFYLWGRKDGLNYVCHLKAPNITYTCQEGP